jgi:hypothetical protein
LIPLVILFNKAKAFWQTPRVGLHVFLEDFLLDMMACLPRVKAGGKPTKHQVLLGVREIEPTYMPVG